MVIEKFKASFAEEIVKNPEKLKLLLAFKRFEVRLSLQTTTMSWRRELRTF